MIHSAGGKQLLHIPSFSVGIGKDSTKKLQPRCTKVKLKTGRAVLSGGQYRSAPSNKKLELKTHSAGHNCILPRYQLPDVMSDPVVITPAPENIDPAVAVVGKEEEALLPAAAVFIAVAALRGAL